MAGIAGTGSTGAESIVLNGGYEDDDDLWDYVVYTGHGGNDPRTGRQIADQELTRGNLALARSCDEGLPVRVVRGWKEPSGFGPASGYRYDGLYYVERYWQERGSSGFRIWRFRLVRDPSASSLPPASAPSSSVARPRPVQLPTNTSSIAAQAVKTMEGHACQVCGVVLRTPSGPYAETAHIRPLGAPHRGSDTADNILCLCPNHRVLFDSGAITISATGDIREVAGGLVVGRVRRDARHDIRQEHLEFHAHLHTGRAIESAS